MKVVMLSKALVVGAYQSKLEELASEPDIDLVCVVPPSWRLEGREQRLERVHLRGYRLVEAPIRFNGSFHFFHFPTLGRLLRQERPDLVHVDEEPYNLATFLAFRAALGVRARPLFFTWQNLLRSYPPPFRWMERRVLARTRYAILGNREAGRVLAAKGYRGPSRVIPQFGVDPDTFSPASRPGTAAGRVVGFVGRLVEEKGLFELLDAAAGLGGDWELRLIGSGPLEAPLRAYAEALGIAGRVRLLGSMPSTSMPAALRELDVLALPSRTQPNWKEQFGRALVEAMACGVAVIGSDSGEIPEVVGEAGLVVGEGDVPALRQGIQRLLDDRELRCELARMGRERVLRRYTQRGVAQATAEVYREVMGQATPRRP
jgi:glycosyltransferase involved in cell wall biosynthesis